MLESTLNGMCRNINLTDIHLTNPLDIQTTDFPVTHWGRKGRLIFNPQSLPDLKGLHTIDKKSYIDVQYAENTVNL